MTADEQPRDHVAPVDPEASAPVNDLQKNVTSRSTWLRLFFMLVIGICYVITRMIFLPVVVFQFFWVLFTGETNRHLHGISQWLASYTYQMMIYLAFNTDEKPFPFDSAAAAVAPADGH